MDTNRELVELRAHLMDMLHWAREESIGMSVVLGKRLSVSELDHEGIPWEDDAGMHDTVQAAAVYAAKQGYDAKPLLLLLQPNAEAERTLSDAIVLVDLLLALGDEPSPTCASSPELTKFLEELIEGLSANQAVVYEVLTSEFSTTSEIASDADRSEPETRRALADLKRMNLVVHRHRRGYRRGHIAS